MVELGIIIALLGVLSVVSSFKSAVRLYALIINMIIILTCLHSLHLGQRPSKRSCQHKIIEYTHLSQILA